MHLIFSCAWNYLCTGCRCCGILRWFGSQGQEESTTTIPTTLASTSMASQEQAQFDPRAIWPQVEFITRHRMLVLHGFTVFDITENIAFYCNCTVMMVEWWHRHALSCGILYATCHDSWKSRWAWPRKNDPSRKGLCLRRKRRQLAKHPSRSSRPGGWVSNWKGSFDLPSGK